MTSLYEIKKLDSAAGIRGEQFLLQAGDYLFLVPFLWQPPHDYL